MPAIEIRVTIVQMVIKRISGAGSKRSERHVGQSMSPRVGYGIHPMVREATIDPCLKRVVIRVSGGLAHRNRPQVWEHPIGGDNAAQIWILIYERGSHFSSVGRQNVICTDAATPQVVALVSDVRELHYRILHDFAGDRQVPLITIRRTEMRADRIEAGAGAYSRDSIYET